MLRTLETLKAAKVADRIVVSTEDKTVAAFCRLRGYKVLDRPGVLAKDDVPLSDVICHVVSNCAGCGHDAPHSGGGLGICLADGCSCDGAPPYARVRACACVRAGVHTPA